MTANGLVDTGALLVLLDRSDAWNKACAGAFAQLRLPLLTSEAVLAELFRLVGDSRHQTGAAWRLVRSGAIVMAPIDNAGLAEIQALMARYADRPMDFADATLVHLARREQLTTILRSIMPTSKPTASTGGGASA